MSHVDITVVNSFLKGANTNLKSDINEALKVVKILNSQVHVSNTAASFLPQTVSLVMALMFILILTQLLSC